MKGGLLAAVMVPVLAMALGLFVVFFGGGAASACAPADATEVNAAAIPQDASVAGFGREQLVNAALIMNAAAARGMSGSAQILGVQAAIGESSLRNISYGDGAINPDGSVADSIGLFQQQSSWGSVAQRMDPTSAATLFFERLERVQGWEELDPSLAINRVQRNADPDHYSKYRAGAVAVSTHLGSLATRGAAGTPAAGCAALSGDSQALAQGLVTAMDSGRLRLHEPRYAQQIRDVAAGTASEDCGIDIRVLQIITLALDTFERVGVSDLNRKCAGSLLGAGTGSSHWIKGGGSAVDFFSFNGTPTTGCDANALRFLDLLDLRVPAGSRAGQIECRRVSYRNIVQFEDSPNHLHFDVAYTDAPLTSG